jgi:hypothetical protein
MEDKYIGSFHIAEPNKPEDMFSFCPESSTHGVGAVGQPVHVHIRQMDSDEVLKAEYGDWIYKYENHYEVVSDLDHQTAMHTENEHSY